MGYNLPDNTEVPLREKQMDDKLTQMQNAVTQPVNGEQTFLGFYQIKHAFSGVYIRNSGLA